jgi:GTPase SAR1 family protein
MRVDGTDVDVALWVTGSEPEFDLLRPLSYSHSDVVLVCFAIDDPDSFHSVRGRVFQFVNMGAKLSGSPRCSILVKEHPSLW